MKLLFGIYGKNEIDLIFNITTDRQKYNKNKSPLEIQMNLLLRIFNHLFSMT